MKRWTAGVFCVLLACMAWAGSSSSEARKTAEATMLVTGWIEVMPDGTVHSYSIDRPEKIPPAVVELIHKNTPSWKFQRNDRMNVIMKARMNLRIVAKRVDEKHDSIAISSASFGNAGAVSTDQISAKQSRIPRYPRDAIDARADGTVFVYARVNRAGKVEDIAVEQVNLGEYGSQLQMRHYRKVLGDAALDAIKDWTFNPPTTGKYAMAPYWDVRIPVTFNLNVIGRPVIGTYGKWRAYIPGPRESIPWAKDSQLSSSPDAIPDGGVSLVDQSLRLTTALGGA